MKKLFTVLMIGMLYSASAQSINIGITIRTIHFKKLSSVTGQKYNNWNPGISIGYQTADNITFEAAVVLNSYKRWTVVGAVGYRYGDIELQLGGATGYKEFGQGWVRPGYFVNYYGRELKVKANHEVINFGVTKQLN